MEQDTNVNADTSNSEGSDQTAETTSQEETVSAAKYKELEDTNRQLFERAKKAEGFVKVDGKWVKAPREEAKNETQAKTGELDETQLDYLDLKGVNEAEDIDVIQAVMKRTGQTVRQALKDEYVQAKLKGNSEKRAVANAMPSGTKRSGAGAGMGLEAAIAKYEQTGEYPSDFELRTQVVNAIVDKASSSVPSWRK